MLEAFINKHPKYKVIFFHVSGSTLYGTNLPTSDIDYRGIFLPPLEDLISKTDIGEWSSSTGDKSSKNSEDDIDITMWSVHKFIKLLEVGDTNAFDTLFAFNTFAEISSTEEMKVIYDNREDMYPDSLRSFFGYALGQVKKYSVKGDKLQDVIKVRDIVFKYDPESKIKDIKEYLILTNNLSLVTDDTAEYYKVLDKRFITNIRLSEFIEKLDGIISAYGTRAKASMDNNLVDWKSMYHAFRVLLECRELMTKGTITFPLAQKDFLLSLRNQEVLPEDAFKMLEELYDEVSNFEKTDDNYLKSVKRKDSKGMICKFYE